MTEKPLYSDSQIEIKIHPSTGPEDQLLYLKRQGKFEEIDYLLQRGALEEVSRHTRDELPDLLWRINSSMVDDASQRGLTSDSLGYAMAVAHIENERRREIEAERTRIRLEQGRGY